MDTTHSDPDCICKGNWRKIIADSTPLFGKTYKDAEGDEWLFFGVIHGDDDYYYGMWRKKDGKLAQLSCVGSIEAFGYELCP